MTIPEKGVKLEEEAAPASSDQEPEKLAEGTPAPAPAPEAPPAAGSVIPGGEKTYTQAEVNRIMHERTKNFAEIKSQYDEYSKLGPLDELRKRVQPASKEQEAPALDEDDKKFIAYLHKVVPGLKELGTGPRLNPEQVAWIENTQKRELSQHETFMKSSEDEVFKYCDTNGITDDIQRVIVRDMIASIILNDPKVSAKWVSKDPSVMADAIAAYTKMRGGAPAPIASDQAKAALKKGTKFIAPMPAGGSPAPITKERAKTDDERVDDAWASLQKP